MVEVFANCDYKVVEQHIKKHRPELKAFGIGVHRLGYCVTQETEDGNQIRVIWLKDFRWDLESRCTMVHEITHLVHHIMIDVSVSTKTDDGSEAHAYLLEYFYREMTRKLEKITKRSK